MTAQLLAPVIPPSGVAASRQRAGPTAARRLPLARPVPVPSAPEDVVYGIARIDSSGRICERAVLIELEPTDHPLAVEQRVGITLARVQEIAETLLHGLPDPALGRYRAGA